MPLVIAEERFNPKEALARLNATAEEYPGLKLIVADMIGELLPLKDTNDYPEMGKVFAPLRHLAERHKLHICVTHHTRKVVTDNPAQMFIGSSAIAGAVDNLICLIPILANNDS